MRTWDSPAVHCNKGASALLITSEIIWRAIVAQPVDFVEVNSNTVTKGYIICFICLFINFKHNHVGNKFPESEENEQK